MNLRAVGCFALVVSACSANAPSSKPAAAAAASPSVAVRMPRSEGAPQAPLVARWQVLSDSGGQLRIAAVIDQKAVFDLPIDVRVELPTGLQLVSGQPAFQMPPSTQPGETTVTFEFTYAAVPSGDLKLVADVSGAAMGVHATDTYRFGRAEVPAVVPQPTGPSIKLGDTDLGPGIQIDKQ